MDKKFCFEYWKFYVGLVAAAFTAIFLEKIVDYLRPSKELLSSGILTVVFLGVYGGIFIKTRKRIKKIRTQIVPVKETGYLEHFFSILAASFFSVSLSLTIIGTIKGNLLFWLFGLSAIFLGTSFVFKKCNI